MAEQASLTFWYVLASDGGPEHRNMCVVSARVLRHVDPAARIGLLCDRPSAEAAQGAGVSLADVFDEVEVRETDGITPMLRSRELKLGLRGWSCHPRRVHLRSRPDRPEPADRPRRYDQYREATQ